MYERITLLSFITMREDTSSKMWKRLLLEELMEFFTTSELTTFLKTSDDPVVIRLEHVDLANETRVEILNLLVRRNFPLQIDS